MKKKFANTDPSKAPANSDIKYQLLSTTQAVMSDRLLYSQEYRKAVKTMANLAAVINGLDRGELRDYVAFYQYMCDMDPKIAELFSARKDRFVSRRWTVEPPKGSTDQADIDAANLCKMALDDLPDWYSIRYSIADAVPLGYSAHEIVWKYVDGIFLPTDLQWVHPGRFLYTRRWELRLSDDYARGGQDGEQLIPDKWVVHSSTERKGYANYNGLVRTVAPVFVKRQWIDQFNLSYLERFGQPWIHGTVDENATEEVMREVYAVLQQASYDHVMVTKGNTGVSIQSPSSSQSIDGYERYLDRSEKLLTQYILGVADMTEAGTNGSEAAVSERIDAVADPKRDRDANALANTIRDQLFRPIIKFNGHLFAKTPRLPVYTEVYAVEQGGAEKAPKESEIHLAKKAGSERITLASATDPLKIEIPEAAENFEETDTYQDKLFQSLLKDLKGNATKAQIAKAKKRLQEITSEGIEKGKSPKEIVDEIMADDAMIAAGVSEDNRGYLESTAQLHTDMAIHGQQWDQAVDAAKETGQPMYWARRNMRDGNVRDGHRIPDTAWFIVGNPDTDRLYPPSDFGCRCYPVFAEKLPANATLYESLPAEFEEAINPEFAW